ncbi:hypothetical protein K438DRAFT_2001190 [Mycena galopus ATCC 62051]|nr:hypothetical protein K438DRAFT_2001190 [Mycena galopus ATCC 62051]
MISARALTLWCRLCSVSKRTACGPAAPPPLTGVVLMVGGRPPALFPSPATSGMSNLGGLWAFANSRWCGTQSAAGGLGAPVWAAEGHVVERHPRGRLCLLCIGIGGHVAGLPSSPSSPPPSLLGEL